MTPETPTQALTFARRVETLENELRDTASWGLYGRSDEPLNDIEQRLFNCGLVMSNGRSGGERLVALHRQDVLAHHLSALVARLGGLRDERKHIMFISGGWATRPVAVPGASGMGPEIPTIGVGPGGRLGRDTTGGGLVDRSWCNTQISRLQGMDSAERLRNLVKDAHRANVSFHPIDPHGLTVSGVSATAAMARNASLRGPFTTRLDTLRALAENTDGTAIVQTNDIAGPMQRLGEDLAAHYLLGYYSTNPAADGRYRTIEVKVSRPGVHVSARPGYLAPTEEMRRAELAAAVRAPTEPTSIDRAFERIARVRADSTLNIDGRTTPSGLDVVVELASREMDTGRWRTGGVVSVSATTSGRGEPLTVEGRIEAGLRGVIVHLPFEPGLPANRGASWRVTASVTAAGETLRRDVDIATEPAGAVGAPLAYRATPSPRSPLAPVADWQFRRTERLHVEWPTNASLTSPTVRLLSRRGDVFPVPVTVTTRTNSDQSIVVADLVLSAVAQGDYALQLSATSGDASVSHVAAFRVVR
jgi:VWFA-related protein